MFEPGDLVEWLDGELYRVTESNHRYTQVVSIEGADISFRTDGLTHAYSEDMYV